MAYARPVEVGLDYYPCRYAGSRLTFRGPRKKLEGKYVAFLGGNETFGRYIEEPFPDLTEETLGVRCINFGVPNAGPDMYLEDEAILDACAGARFTIIQVLGAQTVSNKLFKVHKRHNDRFIRVTDRMLKVYPDIDFTEFHYTRHMLGTLSATSPQRFRLVREEMRKSWMSRMNQLTNRIKTSVVLVWMGERTPDDAADWIEDGEPLFVTRDMLETLRGRIVEVIETPPLTLPVLDGKICSPEEEAAALKMPGPEYHHDLADSLAEIAGDLKLLT